MSPGLRLASLLLPALAAIALDGLTKAWAERALAASGTIPIVDEAFRLTLVYNSGTAFGLFADGGRWLLALTGLIILALLVFLLLCLRAGSLPRATWPLSLMLGGAIANFADRWADGRVTDFLDVGLGAARWPAFNLADSFIVAGVALLMLFTLAGNGSVEAGP